MKGEHTRVDGHRAYVGRIDRYSTQATNPQKDEIGSMIARLQDGRNKDQIDTDRGRSARPS